MNLRYLSVCSGIEAATVAWHPLGWEPVAYAEIEKFPCAVLAHHYPSVPNWGDLTKFREWPDATIDLLVGGTPCQSFSVAGLRKGLADPRGNLALTFLAIADRYRPQWVVWENVPGVLSSNGGRDFGAFLGGLGQLGYGFAYRVLDAQYFGLAQRRARVFVVGHLGDWRRAAAVLFERESLSGHPAPRREAGERATGTLSSRTSAGGGLGTDFDVDGGVVPILDGAEGRTDGRGTPLVPVAHSLRADGFDASEDGTGRGTPIVPVTHALDSYSAGRATEDGTGRGCPIIPAIAFSAKDHGADAGDLAPTLRAGGFTNSHANGGCMPAVAFALGSHSGAADADVSNRSHASGGPSGMGISEELSHSLRAGRTQSVAAAMQVRRLTPRECERLQGFPDDYTLIPYRGKPAADGPRYKALGNSMAVPVMAWIGRRIALVEQILKELAA
jgi:DNA (cytosine-5)-methyltransferase 1